MVWVGEVIEVVYEGGVLRPLGELNLREGERVKICIVGRSRSLSEVIREISREYVGVGRDPLKLLLEGRR